MGLNMTIQNGVGSASSCHLCIHRLGSFEFHATVFPDPYLLMQSLHVKGKQGDTWGVSMELHGVWYHTGQAFRGQITMWRIQKQGKVERKQKTKTNPNVKKQNIEHTGKQTLNKYTEIHASTSRKEYWLHYGIFPWFNHSFPHSLTSLATPPLPLLNYVGARELHVV